MRHRKTSPERQVDEAATGLEQTRIFRKSDVRPERPRRSWLKIVGIAVLCVALFAGGAVFGFYRFTKTPSETLVPAGYANGGRVNILVLGIDTGVNGPLKNPQADLTGTRSDTMMLVSFDTNTKEVGILSIPRDTRVFIPEPISAYEKITHAHAYGGPELSVKTVASFLKVDIHHYVRLDFEAFKKAVDLLGGIDIDVPEDMNYDDPFQDLHIHLKKGLQHLDGSQALGFVRYRQYYNGDIGRIGMQEQFLKALVSKLASVSGALKLPELVSTMAPYVKTDLSTDDILRLANLALGVKPEDVKMGMVPGVDRSIDDGDGNGPLSYWIADKTAMAEMVDELVKGISKEKNATIKVAIENGNGIAGAADSLATILRDEGFNVVSVGDANKQDYPETKVVSAAGNLDLQSAVLRGLVSVCPSAKMVTGKVPAEADVLVIVGRDFKPYGSQ